GRLEAMGAYGDRWHSNPGWLRKRKDGLDGLSQIGGAIKLLKEKPNTRQAVVSMWDSGDLFEAIRGEWKDIPCTIALQFFVRDSKLHAVAYMRSNDAWLGMPYDVFCFCATQIMIANELDLNIGTYTHVAGSMHIYQRDVPKFDVYQGSPVRGTSCRIETKGASISAMNAAITGESIMRGRVH